MTMTGDETRLLCREWHPLCQRPVEVNHPETHPSDLTAVNPLSEPSLDLFCVNVIVIIRLA